MGVGDGSAKREDDSMAIQGLIAKGESDILEFKVSFGKDVIETVTRRCILITGRVATGFSPA